MATLATSTQSCGNPNTTLGELHFPIYCEVPQHLTRTTLSLDLATRIYSSTRQGTTIFDFNSAACYQLLHISSSTPHKHRCLGRRSLRVPPQLPRSLQTTYHCELVEASSASTFVSASRSSSAKTKQPQSSIPRPTFATLLFEAAQHFQWLRYPHRKPAAVA